MKRSGRHSQGANDFLMPYAPTIGTATDVGISRPYNNGAANVTFTADPINAATSFTVTSSPGGYTATGSSSPIMVTGLQSAVQYTFTVTATNSYGTSTSSSASNQITATTVPDTPTMNATTSVSNTATDIVSWNAPADGGSAITNYHWTSDDGKSGDAGTATSVNVAQEAGTSQSYNVYATNANGNSNTSSYSGAFTSFSFTPFGFTPFGFTPFGFAPFGAFGFAPFGAFGFTPGSRYCVDQDTLITLVGPNDSIIYKAASEVEVGDEVWAPTFDEYIDESEDGYQGYLFSKTLTNASVTKCTIQVITPSTRTETLYFNGDMAKRFSLTERMLMKRNDIYQYIPSGDVVVGDIYIAADENNNIFEVPVTSVDIIEGERNVYRFTVEPVDHLIAGGMVVHNFK